jgi:hypothetical protein
VESHLGIDRYGLEIGDVKRTGYAGHELPETRPSKGTKGTGRRHVEYDAGGTSVHDVYWISVRSGGSCQGTAPTVQVREVRLNVEFIGNGAIKTCVHKLQIQHDPPVKVLETINIS